MKSVFIVYNQAHTIPVLEILDRLSIRGYTGWQNLTGRGTDTGEPHLGSHAWPARNSATLAIVPDEKLPELKKHLKILNDAAPKQGLRMFAWDICDSL